MTTPTQTSLASMFMGGGVKKPAKAAKSKATTTATAATEAEATTTTESVVAKLTNPNPLVQEYYDQLTPSQVIAHSLAVEKLGTSYDVVRTHGFLRWMKARA